MFGESDDLSMLTTEQRQMLNELYVVRGEIAEAQILLIRLKQIALADPTPENQDRLSDYEKTIMEALRHAESKLSTRLLEKAIDREKLAEVIELVKPLVGPLILGNLTSLQNVKLDMVISGETNPFELLDAQALENMAPMIVAALAQAIVMPLALEALDSSAPVKRPLTQALDKFLRQGL